MLALSLAFVDIALHRRGPEDLPASQFLFGLVLVVYLAVGIAALSLGSTLERAAVLLAFDSSLYLAAIWAVLNAFGKPRRFLQTATAMLGADLLLNLVALPLQFWDQALDAPETKPTAPRLLFLVLYFWSIDIGGFILSRAIGRPYIVGVSIVIVFALASMVLRDAFFS